MLKALKSTFNFKIDAHLMVSNPTELIPKFIQTGAEWISFHFETPDNIGKNIDLIKDNDRKAGIVLNPDTDVDEIFPFLGKLDYVLLMSVYPGKGGQKFIESTLPRASRLKERIRQEGHNCLIQVDGGINASNIGNVKAAGGDLFVIGTFLYNSDNITQTLYNINNIINGA
jgi:ribulose-phosphate 3-epimerase